MTEHHREADWFALTRKMRPLYDAQVRAGVAVCIDCHRPIVPGQRFAVGHRVSVKEGKARGWTKQQINDPSNLGPTHSARGGKGDGSRRCNEQGGGRIGGRARTTKQAEQKRRPDWRTW
ncbi:hypothetical protein [Schumannella soli]|uniref:Uncharacterized protein n=1 Tax=Schumannella soli TaxID=2590779 RepID=A0A506Y2Q9_9MICO|nr:hypothetical protein [Schumannella soli]TPW75890.1 hypothetical protein FJ657_08565 [Schumannella soli]